MHRKYIYMHSNIIYFGGKTVYFEQLGDAQKYVHFYFSTHYINKQADKGKSITFG